MKIDIFHFDVVYPLGESATHPIELLATRLGCCSSLKAATFRVVAPIQTRRQQPTLAMDHNKLCIWLVRFERAASLQIADVAGPHRTICA
jgi:hypothetical protein